jgi:tetratricopeptide (TPR) repeat protein
MTHFRNADYRTEVSIWQDTVAKAQGNERALRNLGVALDRVGRYDEAVSSYHKALAIRPDCAEAHFALGVAQFKQGRLDDAILQYFAALRIKPDYAAAMQDLGVALSQQGRLREALNQWRGVLRLRPDNIRLINEMAWIFATSRDAEIRSGAEAVALATKAAKLCGARDPAVLDTLAAAYAEVGAYNDAARAARIAVRLAEGQHDAPLAARIAARLRLYEAGMPYHDSR